MKKSKAFPHLPGSEVEAAVSMRKGKPADQHTARDHATVGTSDPLPKLYKMVGAHALARALLPAGAVNEVQGLAQLILSFERSLADIAKAATQINNYGLVPPQE